MAASRGASDSADPAKPSLGSSAAKPSTPLSVTQLSELVSGVIDGLPKKMVVRGQVSGFRTPRHWYFDLKDDNAVVSCVAWQGAASRFGLEPTDGQEVVVTVSANYWAKGGKLSFVVEKIEQVGVGALEVRFRQLVAEIRELGWFDDARKRPLPRFPKRVAIVTSRSGAALQDVLVTMASRCSAIPVLLVDARVQGPDAPDDIAAASREVGARADELNVDVLLVTRGGGSMEDLWAFNEKVVAQAIVQCPIPVIAAIGHETDTTIAELVADVRASTPTQAATRLAPDAESVTEQLDQYGARLRSLVVRMVRSEQQRLASAARHPFFARPGTWIETGRANLIDSEEAIGAAMHGLLAALERKVADLGRELDHQSPSTRIDRQGEMLGTFRASLERAIGKAIASKVAGVDSAERALRAIGPLRVLDRGYSITHRVDGSVLRSASTVGPGEVLHTRLADGTLRSVVDGVQANGESKPRVRLQIPRQVERSKPATTKSQRTKHDSGDLGLFGEA